MACFPAAAPSVDVDPEAMLDDFLQELQEVGAVYGKSLCLFSVLIMYGKCHLRYLYFQLSLMLIFMVRLRRTKGLEPRQLYCPILSSVM